MSSKLDLASGWRNSDLGVNTISWSSRDKERDRTCKVTWTTLSCMLSHILCPSCYAIVLSWHLQASWRAAGSVCGERGNSLQEKSSWQWSSYSRTADALRSPLAVSDKRSGGNGEPTQVSVSSSKPAHITKSFFRFLRSLIIWPFIWGYKSHRIPTAHPHKPLKKGCLSLSILKHNYWAANSRALTGWKSGWKFQLLVY